MANIPELKAGAKPSDKPGAPAKPQPTGACDCKKIAKGYYCVTDKRELTIDDVRNGMCKRCETKPLQIEYCVKLVAKTLSKQQIKDGMQPYDEDKARIAYECESCAAKADLETEVKHKPDCKPKTIGGGLKKVCAKSGKFPHASDDK